MVAIISTDGRATNAFWESQLFAAIIGATIPLLVLAFLEVRKHSKEKGARSALLYLFALECVHLFERFVQYCDQILPEKGKPAISRSIPYEMVPASAIARLVELGVPEYVLKSIYQVRQLNAQVTLQCHRANDILVQEHMEDVRFEYEKALDSGRGASKVDSIEFDDPLSHSTFRSIFRFVADEISQTRHAVEMLLIEAENAKGRKLSSGVRKLFEETKLKYEGVKKRYDSQNA